MSRTTPSPQRRRTRTASADVQQALVDAAEAVLVRDGPGAVTVRAVAAEAAVAPMGIYSRLGGKDGLTAALLIRGFDRLRAAVADQGETDPLERLRGSGLRYRRFALANPQYYAVMFTDAIPHAGDSDEVAEHAAAAFGELVGHVQHAMTAGRIRAGDPLEVAQQLWSTVHGATALELTGLVLTPDPESTYEALIESLLRGLGA
ncbi:MAG TPA: TetR-like C-terminal domain-containing protein [Mycobacteriales bacterium]